MNYLSEKTCTACQYSKPLNEFRIRKNSKDGRQNKCKICARKYHSEYNYSNGIYPGKQKKPKTIPLSKNEYQRRYLSQSPERRMKANMRSRLSQAITGFSKPCSAIKDLGCSWDEFKQHIQSKFTEGMTWENYGDWHIDHIHPLAKCHSSEELVLACKFTNLQPLWAKDNIRKSDKIY